MNKIISIIIATYNEEKYIEKCLRSLLAQDYKTYEIIVVDDGSKDKTKSVVKNYPKIKYYQQQHQGTALSRNFGVTQSKGDILVFVDADMEFATNFISKLTAPIFEKGIRGTFSKLEYVKNWEKPLARCWNRSNNPSLQDKLRVPQNIDFGEDFRAILKSEFIKVNGFDNIGYTDTWTLKQKLGYRSINTPDAIYYHYNPETYREIFYSSQWIGKRLCKMGKFGNIIAIIRSFVIISIIKGISRTLIYRDWQFIPFQIIYDLGITSGAIQKIIVNKVSK